MPGMLSQAQPPSSGPGPQTPQAGGAPGAGAAPPAGLAAGPGQPQGGTDASFEELRDQGVQRLYGDNFDKLIQMFERNGAEQFPRSMAVAVNGTLDFLESKHGPLPPEMAAEVGMDVMMKLLEDMIGGGVVPDVTLEQVQQAFPAILTMYADSHPNVSKQDVQQLVAEVQKGVIQAEGGAPAPDGAPAPAGEQRDPNAPLNTGPGAPPGNTPVPPGVMV